MILFVALNRRWNGSAPFRGRNETKDSFEHCTEDMGAARIPSRGKGRPRRFPYIYIYILKSFRTVFNDLPRHFIFWANGPACFFPDNMIRLSTALYINPVLC
jgi:hypothetical protein